LHPLVPIGKRRFRHIQIQSDELFLAFEHLAGQAKEEVKIGSLGDSNLLQEANMTDFQGQVARRSYLPERYGL
jgi:hypothetical protein